MSDYKTFCIIKSSILSKTNINIFMVRFRLMFKVDF